LRTKTKVRTHQENEKRNVQSSKASTDCRFYVKISVLYFEQVANSFEFHVKRLT